MFNDYLSNREWAFSFGPYQQMLLACKINQLVAVGFSTPDALQTVRIFESENPIPSEDVCKAMYEQALLESGIDEDALLN